MKFNSIRMFLTIIAIAALACMAANAGTITYPASPLTFSGPTDYTHTFQLQQWDPTVFPGQTLQSVLINFTVGADIGTITLSTTATSSQTFNLALQSDVLSTGPSGALSPNDISLTLFSTSGYITLGGTGNPVCGTNPPSASCSSVSYTPGSVNGSSSSLLTSALSPYIGSSTFALTGQTIGSTTLKGGTNIAFSINEVATMTGQVTYTYAASGAPEPATLAMLGSALIGLGLIGRKRFVR